MNRQDNLMTKTCRSKMRTLLVIILASMIGYCWYFNPYHRYKKQYPRMSLYIYMVANGESYLHGIRTGLTLSVIDHESAKTWRPTITNGYDDGLMQINRVHKLKDPFNVKNNICFGVKYLKKCIDKHGLYNGIMAYNQGPNRKTFTNYMYLRAILRGMI